MRVEAFGLSRAGRDRDQCADVFRLDDEHGLFVVADGSAGARPSPVAGQMAADVVQADLTAVTTAASAAGQSFPEARERVLAELRRAVNRACTTVFHEGLTHAEYRGMATTVVACQLVGPSAVIAHVGNSRVYMVRGQRLFRLTQDHTTFQELLERGLLTHEEAESFPYKDVLSRSVGAKPVVDVDLMATDVADGDRLVLCTDGVTAVLGEGQVLTTASQLEPAEAARKLVELAVSAGTRDDATAVVIGFSDVVPERNVISIERKVAHLKAVFLFADLDFQEMLRVLEAVDETFVPEGEPIVREGETGDAFYVIGIGSAAVSRHGRPLTRLQEGDHFGELALLGGGVRSATVTAETDAVLLSIRAEELSNLINQSPRLGNKLLWRLLLNLSERVRSLTDELSSDQAAVPSQEEDGGGGD